MQNKKMIQEQTRRDFLKKVTVTGSAVYFGMGGIFASARPHRKDTIRPFNFKYKFKTVSVKHVQELKKWFDKLYAEKRIGNNQTFRKYLSGFNFNSEEILAGAKSIIVVSTEQKISSIIFNHKGKKTEILIPTGYVDDGLTYKLVKERLMKDIIKDPGKKIQEGIRLPIKTVSVRSGLADYGKNNITFVDEFGSFHQLLGFYTDAELEDNWRPLNMLRLCKGCSICIKDCPTQCIREDNFIINVDKCITLYNEIATPIPDYIPGDAHHTQVGCLKCQYPCPANASRINDIDNLAEISEDETDFLLGNKKDKKMHDRIAGKLARYPSAKNLDYFRRNFKLAFANLSAG